jgi:hypothetical protein
MVGPVSGEATVVAAKDQVSCQLQGEVAILQLKSGVYFGLNPVGAWIWDLIQAPKTVNQVRDAMLQRYDVDPEQCERDLQALLQELAAADLIEIREGLGPGGER